MKIKIIIYLIITFFYINVHTVAVTSNNFFLEGKNLFDAKKFNKAKIQFEKDIVFNPKNYNSYLYLAKIFNEENKDKLEKNNLKTVITLDPKNEEAIYYLVLLNIKESNFTEAENNIKKLKLICNKLCSKNKLLNSKLNDLLKK